MMMRKDEGDGLGWGSRTRMEGVGEEAVPSTACSAVPAASDLPSPEELANFKGGGRRLGFWEGKCQFFESEGVVDDFCV